MIQCLKKSTDETYFHYSISFRKKNLHNIHRDQASKETKITHTHTHTQTHTHTHSHTKENFLTLTLWRWSETLLFIWFADYYLLIFRSIREVLVTVLQNCIEKRTSYSQRRWSFFRYSWLWFTGYLHKWMQMNATLHKKWKVFHQGLLQ